MTNSTGISPLRQRMIDDMVARGLVPQTQKGHVRACKRFAAFLKRSPDTATADDVRLFQLHLIESGAQHLQSQPHHDRGAVPVAGDAAPARPRGRDLSHQGAAEDSAGPECRRGQAAVDDGAEPQGPRAAQHRLWLRVCAPARWSASRSSTSTARRDHSRRASRRAARIAM